MASAHVWHGKLSVIRGDLRREERFEQLLRCASCRSPSKWGLVLQAADVEFWVLGSRYRLCPAAVARAEGGRVVPYGAAERVITAALREGEGASLRRAYAGRNAQRPSPSTSNAEILRWLGRALSASSGPATAQLVLLQSGFGASYRTGPSDAPLSDAERVLQELKLARADEVQHRGSSYRIALAGEHRRSSGDGLYEAMAPGMAKEVLAELAAEPSRQPLRTLLEKASMLVAPSTQTSPHEQLVLLRRERVHIRPEETSTAVTPSRLRQLKETQWVEVFVIDGDGKPVAGERFELKLADGSIKQGVADDEGLAFFGGVPPGECQVVVPGYLPSKPKKKKAG